jgi:PKD repeat protein
MKKIAAFLATTLVVVCFSACQKVPEASFTVIDETVGSGESVKFTNTSVDATSYFWDFDDGSTSTEASPSHIFTSEGTYMVSLTAYSKNEKKTSIAVVTINVVNPVNLIPVADFIFSPSTVYTSTVVTFTDQSTHNPTSWAWNFGDGGTSTTQNPTHSYTTVGTYKVTLTVSNSHGSSFDSLYVNVVNALDYLEGSYNVQDSSMYGIFDYTDNITVSQVYANRVDVTKFAYYLNGAVYFTISGYNVTIPTQTVNCGSPAANRTFSGTGTINPAGPVITINYTEVTGGNTTVGRETYVKN